MHKGSTAHSLRVGLCVSLWSLIMKSNTVQSLNMLSHRPLRDSQLNAKHADIAAKMHMNACWLLRALEQMTDVADNKKKHASRRVREMKYIWKEAKQREELSSAAVAKGGLALTNPFFFDLFIQMKEQNEAGLCRTIALSPQTLTWSAFTRALIIFNYAHFLTSCNSYTAGLKLSSCPSAPLQPPSFVLLSFSSPDSMPVVSADKLNGPELQLVV